STPAGLLAAYSTTPISAWPTIAGSSTPPTATFSRSGSGATSRSVLPRLFRKGLRRERSASAAGTARERRHRLVRSAERGRLGRGGQSPGNGPARSRLLGPILARPATTSATRGVGVRPCLPA